MTVCCLSQVLPPKLGGTGALRPVEDVWKQVLGQPFQHSTTMHKATAKTADTNPDHADIDSGDTTMCSAPPAGAPSLAGGA